MKKVESKRQHARNINEIQNAFLSSQLNITNIWDIRWYFFLSKQLMYKINIINGFLLEKYDISWQNSRLWRNLSNFLGKIWGNSSDNRFRIFVRISSKLLPRKKKKQNCFRLISYCWGNISWMWKASQRILCCSLGKWTCGMIYGSVKRT